MSALRVLLIDDEDDIRQVAELSLRLVGKMDVRTAASGEEGVRLAAAEPPDAILLDAMMPGLDGPSTLEALLADERTRRVPVVFLTAKQQAADRERFLALGAAGVIAKPFDPMQLASELRDVLGLT